jgi:hypothetical protein
MLLCAGEPAAWKASVLLDLRFLEGADGPLEDKIHAEAEERRQGEDEPKEDAAGAQCRRAERGEEEHEQADGKNRPGGSTPRAKVQGVSAFLVPRCGAVRNGRGSHEGRSGGAFEAGSFREFGDQTQVAEFTKGDLPVILESETRDAVGAFLGRDMRPASSQTFRIDAAQSSFLERLPDGILEVR